MVHAAPLSGMRTAVRSTSIHMFSIIAGAPCYSRTEHNGKCDHSSSTHCPVGVGLLLVSEHQVHLLQFRVLITLNYDMTVDITIVTIEVVNLQLAIF